ncbi:hypothetical protein, conserved [Babesia bigemina]|uniref:C3H1-type domain-containing protein n=1 Tax=Babesia bigemina TaxID=5866 RepID=A0A061BK55_BABBI|nr:hypothetical protein, conserved [Babesia bigemina]CDR71832.1 hypothetical protein, conserved [Babesia bigemina]|eukprot:XP_012770775.1 hypothetical protein, conserved [Babesia bigemina]
MGFLSGVLSNIQDHLGQHKEQITEAIKSLNTNKHAGKKGFNVAIGQVVAGVRGYNGNVRNSNNHVKSKIEDLYDYVAESGKLTKGFNALQVTDDPRQAEKAVQSAGTLVTGCLTKAKEFLGDLDMSKKDIDELNNKLMLNVYNARDIVEHEYNRLSQLSGKEKKDMISMIEKMSERFAMLKKNINNQINAEVSDVVEKLKDRVIAIRNKLEGINTRLKEYVQKLEIWISDAKKFIKEANERYVSKIINTGIGYVNREAIKEKAEELKDKGEEVYGHLQWANERVETLCGVAKQKVEELATAVKADLFQLKQEIQTGMDKYVRDYINLVKKKVVNINDNEGDGLKKMETEVKAWAQTFSSQDAFGITVEGWIEDILEKDEFVRNLFPAYVNVNLKFKRMLVASVFKKHLMKGYIDQAGQAVSRLYDKVEATHANSKLQIYVTAVKDGIDEFVRLLGSKINGSGASDFVKQIATGIHDNESIVSLPKKHGNAPPNLIHGVKYALNQLVCVGRQKAADLEWFIGKGEKKGNTPNVDVALKIVDELNANFTDAIKLGIEISEDAKTYNPYATDSGTPISLDVNIAKTIGDALDRQIGKNSNIRGRDNQIENLDKLAHSFGTSAKGIGSRRKLNDAIDEIKNDLAEAFKFNVENKYVKSKEALRKGQKAEDGELHKLYNEIKGHLDKLTQEFSETGEKVNWYFSVLTGDMINRDLTDIMTNLYEVQNGLAGAIQDCLNLEKFATDQCTATIRTLTSIVDDQVQRSKTAITIEVQDRYVSSIRGLLKAFADKVYKELHELPDAIERDKRIGFKGFMEKVEININVFSNKDDLNSLATDVNNASRKLIGYIMPEIHVMSPVRSQLTNIKDACDALFTPLSHCKHTPYDHHFTSRLAKLKGHLNACSPEQFEGPANSKLIDVMRSGWEALVNELSKAYVNTYSGETTKWDDENNPETKYCAKIFLTISSTIYDDFKRLHYKCKRDWNDRRLCETNEGRDNQLGLFLKRGGYEVARDEGSKDGELNFFSTTYSGRNIFGILDKVIYVAQHEHVPQCRSPKKTHNFNIIDFIECLVDHINDYNDVCHYSTFTSKKQPCSVYEMLCWLTGLPHNPAYTSLLNEALPPLFESPKPAKTIEDDVEFEVVDHGVFYMDTYPQKTTYNDIEKVITDICSISYDVATCIAGTGDAETVYGSDLCTNSMKFRYPTSGEECLDMFLDILRRLFPPLKFLQMQCSVSELHNGWRKCYYGRDVSSANLPCKEHSSDKSKCQPNCKAKYEPKCQPKSPLQSYLSDCLSGHLPHVVTSIGCKSECATCPRSKPGMPCITPLGFRGFSGSTRRGRDICDVLDRWFKISNFNNLFCLVLNTPKSLPDHFGFALSLASGLTARKPSYDDTIKTVGDTFKAAMQNVSMKLYEDTSKLVGGITDAYGSELSTHSKCEDHHLVSLTRYGTCDEEGLYSAPFLYSLSTDYCDYRRKKHAGTYLSWAVYLPWDFWKYLKSLYEEFCNIKCQNWGCRPCLHGTTCKAGEHGIIDTSCKCSSVVNCRGVLPTLYKYGFTFANAANLSADKKTCFYLHTQLNNVIKSKYFTNLFEECDNFLYYIRFPFMTLTLALWLLTLLYLLHIMVIRLDLLHIKSHLHSPSSHRIAAQSLLAAARVNKLNRVFYLQP